MKSQDLEQLMSDFFNVTGSPVSKINSSYGRFAKSMTASSDGRLRQYDKTYRFGPLIAPVIVYVELKLGDALYNHFRMDWEEPKLTTVKNMEELTNLRVQKQKELNKKARLEPNRLFASLATGIKSKQSVEVDDWRKYGLGSIMVPIVDDENDLELKTAEVVSCHAQYDLKDETECCSIDDFVGAREKVILRKLQKENSIFVEPKIVLNLCFNDNEAHCYLLKNSKENVLGVDVDLNSVGLQRRLSNLLETRSGLIKYLNGSI